MVLAKTGARIVVAAFGSNGIEELQKAFEDNSQTVSWGLVRIEVGSGTCILTKYVAITCIGEGTAPVLRGRLTERTGEAMHLLGPTNASLQMTCAAECTVDRVLQQVHRFVAADHLGDYSIDKLRQEYTALVKATEMQHRLTPMCSKLDHADESQAELTVSVAVDSASTTASTNSECGEPLPMTLQECLTEVADFGGCLNWVIFEPEELSLHHAGNGGLEQMKQWLEPDKVMWGVFSVFLGGNPPIFKHIFVHWIGLKVPAMKCGQWNFKTAQVVEKVQTHLTISHKITAHGLRDLDLPGLIITLQRMMYGVQALDTINRKAIAEIKENYAEDLKEPVAGLQNALLNAPASEEEAPTEKVWEEVQVREDPLRESHSAIPGIADVLNFVRTPNGRWNWVLLKVDGKPSTDLK